jgi:quinol monooxygenase YgiN
MEGPMIVRISRGRFDPAKADGVAATLTSTQTQLIPAIQQLPGLLHYYVGIDRASTTMVNVSIWDSVEHAQQMSTLAPMLALREQFETLGVQFDPIVNYETLWRIDPAG